MSKNAVTDWSATDSLNTDIGGTNIAEGCAPGGINDAIRKLMAQVATYITDALYTILRIGDTNFNLALSSSNPRVTVDTNDYFGYDRTGNSYSFSIASTSRLTISSTGIGATGTVTAGVTGTSGSIRLAPGSGSASGDVEFLDTAGGIIGYIQQTIGGDLSFVQQGSTTGFGFQGTYLIVRRPGMAGVIIGNGTGSVTGKFTMTDAAGNSSAYIGGQTVGQATPYSNTAGHLFDGNVQTSGQVIGVATGTGSNGGVVVRGSSGGSQAYLQMTNNSGGTEWAHFRTEGSKLVCSISSTDVFSIDTSGNMRILGTLTQSTTP